MMSTTELSVPVSEPRESLRTRILRWGLNLYPGLRGSGGRVTFIARDYHEIRIRLPLNWRTRNYIGSIFGGSMFSVSDPVYMLMLIHLLGEKYFVVDKAGSIKFIKIARTTLYATFRISPEEVAAIRDLLEQQEKLDRVYSVDLVDAQGVVHATVERTVHIRKRRPPADSAPKPASA